MTVPLLLLFLLGPTSANDPLPTLKKCGPPIAPVGIVSLQSTLAFEVSAKGEPRPDDLSILEVTGASAAELHSVLERILPACTFKPGKHSPAIRIRTTLTIENGLLRWGPVSSALPGDTADASGLSTPATLSATDTLAFTDPRLETGTTTRRSLVLILQDASKPRSTHAMDWKPRGLCAGRSN